MALAYPEDRLGIEESNRRIAEPRPAITLESIIREFSLED
jgi:hypothetical protein